jgi:HEAT repeat protein
MNQTIEEHLDRLIALYAANRSRLTSKRDFVLLQYELEHLHRREPEILIRLFRYERQDIRQATAAVVADLLHDPDPVIRNGIYHALMVTETSLFLKPLYEYLLQNGYSDEILNLAKITSRAACPAASPTYACVGRNTVLAWRLVSLMTGLVYQNGLP